MLAIIIVNYKNEQRTIKYVVEELSKIVSQHLVVIVNNLASEESNNCLIMALDAELIENVNNCPNTSKLCYVISMSDNIGFAKGNNVGVKFACKYFKVKYLLFSNNDIVFKDYDVVEKLITKLDTNQDIGLIGPKILGLDGNPQSPHGFISFWDKYIWPFWLSPFLTQRLKSRIFDLEYSKNAEEGFHYRIMGSFMLIRAVDFIKCGMMDYNTFLYCEEVILSERLLKIGKKCYFYPVVSIVHEHGQTTTKHLTYNKLIKQQFISDKYYYSKYLKVSSLSIIIGQITLFFYMLYKNFKFKIIFSNFCWL